LGVVSLELAPQFGVGVHSLDGEGADALEEIEAGASIDRRQRPYERCVDERLQELERARAEQRFRTFHRKAATKTRADEESMPRRVGQKLPAPVDHVAHRRLATVVSSERRANVLSAADAL